MSNTFAVARTLRRIRELGSQAPARSTAPDAPPAQPATDTQPEEPKADARHDPR